MTLDEADAVPAYYELPERCAFNAGPYHATIDPQASRRTACSNVPTLSCCE